jgi:uncharacterized membrane protein
MIVYATFFTVYNLQQHAVFQTTGYDLGNYNQAMWNTLRGKPLAMTTIVRRLLLAPVPGHLSGVNA